MITSDLRDTYDEDMARAEYVAERAEELCMQWVDDPLKIANAKDCIPAEDRTHIGYAAIYGDAEELSAAIFQATCRVLRTWAEADAMAEYSANNQGA